MTGYTIIDFETTGLFPQNHDRVVEIGVVYVSAQGEIEGHWDTLINPRRDMGATHIHGITATDVFNAPTFEQIAPHLLRAIAGRTIVAHNALFDLNFLEHEFQRVGVTLNPGTPAVCTMEWSGRFIPGVSRRLVDCCSAVGIERDGAHSAAGDAMATAGLLAHYMRVGGSPPPWEMTLRSAALHGWPTFQGDMPRVSMVQRSTAKERPEAWLDRVTSKMPRVENPAVESYLDVLDRALLDAHLSAHEKQALIAVAVDLGLHRDQLHEIHRVYLSAMAAAAWADGTVTDEERDQLLQVATALGIAPDRAEQALTAAEGAAKPFQLPTLSLLAGDRVVFTGELKYPRDAWIARVAALGIEHGTVTKGTRVVIAADPDSMSGKAGKARSYNIPIITEAAFEYLIAAMEHQREDRAKAISGE